MEKRITLLNLLVLFLLATTVQGQVVSDTLQQIETVDILKSRTQINQVNSLHLGVKQIEAMPKMMGIADPLKAVRFLPGFGNGGDANAGLFYRGLSSSNNGYYYNGVEVHNPSHLFGLFPIFNTHAIKEVSVKHGVVPGRYVGKLSGYIDILSDWELGDTTIVKGDLSLFHLGVGTRLESDSSRMLEVYWRNTFMNRTLWPLLGGILDDQKGVNYDLYDLNINAMQVLKRGSLKLFAYTGRDKASFGLYEGSVANNLKWGNIVGGISHLLPLTSDLQLENRVGYGQYKAAVIFDFLNDSFSFDSRQRNLNLNSTLRYQVGSNLLETGLLYSVEDLRTNLQEANPSRTTADELYASKQRIFQYFINGTYNWTDRVKTEASLQTAYLSTISNQLFVHPALSTLYQFHPQHALFAGASMGFQPTQQIALTSIHMPIDYGCDVKPGYWMPGL